MGKGKNKVKVLYHGKDGRITVSPKTLTIIFYLDNIPPEKRYTIIYAFIPPKEVSGEIGAIAFLIDLKGNDYPNFTEAFYILVSHFREKGELTLPPEAKIEKKKYPIQYWGENDEGEGKVIKTQYHSMLILEVETHFGVAYLPPNECFLEFLFEHREALYPYLHGAYMKALTPRTLPTTAPFEKSLQGATRKEKKNYLQQYKRSEGKYPDDVWNKYIAHDRKIAPENLLELGVLLNDTEIEVLHGLLRLAYMRYESLCFKTTVSEIIRWSGMESGGKQRKDVKKALYKLRELPVHNFIPSTDGGFFYYKDTLLKTVEYVPKGSGIEPDSTFEIGESETAKEIQGSLFSEIFYICLPEKLFKDQHIIYAFDAYRKLKELKKLKVIRRVSKYHRALMGYFIYLIKSEKDGYKKEAITFTRKYKTFYEKLKFPPSMRFPSYLTPLFDDFKTIGVIENYHTDPKKKTLTFTIKTHSLIFTIKKPLN